MPITIPTYGQSEVTPNVVTQPHANESTPLQNFGGGDAVNEAGKAISGVAKVTNDIFLAQKKQADDAKGQQVFADLTKFKNDLIYNPQSGAMTKKGENALSVVGDYGKQFNDYSDQVSSGLQNDEQRAQFNHFKREVGNDLNTTLTKYTYGESQNLQSQIAETGVKTAQDDAILNYHEPGKIEESIKLQSNLLTNTFKRAGLPKEVIDEKVQSAKSATYAGVIDRMLVNGQDMQAKAYYNEVKDQIKAKDAVSLEKSLEAGSMRGESQRQSDKIYENNDSLSDALDDARKISDPKLRDETVKRVKERFSDDEAATKQDDEMRFRSASQILEKSGSLDSIPPQILGNLPSSQKRALEVRFTQIRDGIEPEANGETKYNLQQMAVTPELRDKFLGTNLEEYRHLVTHSELSSLMQVQASMRKSDGEADDTIRGLRSRTQIVNETTKQIGVDKDPDAVLKINRQLDDQIAQFQQDQGKKASGQEIQKMMDNIIVKAKDPSSGIFGFFQSARAYNQDPAHPLSVSIDDIPSSEKSQIVRALNARHIPVTDQKVEELYARKINGMRQRGQ